MKGLETTADGVSETENTPVARAIAGNVTAFSKSQLFKWRVSFTGSGLEGNDQESIEWSLLKFLYELQDYATNADQLEWALTTLGRYLYDVQESWGSFSKSCISLVDNLKKYPEFIAMGQPGEGREHPAAAEIREIVESACEYVPALIDTVQSLQNSVGRMLAVQNDPPTSHPYLEFQNSGSELLRLAELKFGSANLLIGVEQDPVSGMWKYSYDAEIISEQVEWAVSQNLLIQPYYHGTRPDSAEAIMADGIRPSSWGADGRGVYLADDIATTEAYASRIEGSGHGSGGNADGLGPIVLAKYDDTKPILVIQAVAAGENKFRAVYPKNGEFPTGANSSEWWNGWARDHGFGALYVAHVSMTTKEIYGHFVAFDPKSLKLAAKIPGAEHPAHPKSSKFSAERKEKARMAHETAASINEVSHKRGRKAKNLLQQTPDPKTASEQGSFGSGVPMGKQFRGEYKVPGTDRGKGYWKDAAITGRFAHLYLDESNYQLMMVEPSANGAVEQTVFKDMQAAGRRPYPKGKYGWVVSNSAPETFFLFNEQVAEITIVKGDVVTVESEFVAFDDQWQKMQSLKEAMERGEIDDWYIKVAHHSTPVAGRNVTGAGEITIGERGAIMELNNKSGHYKPDEKSMKNSVKALQELGYDMTGEKSGKSPLITLQGAFDLQGNATQKVTLTGAQYLSVPSEASIADMRRKNSLTAAVKSEGAEGIRDAGQDEQHFYTFRIEFTKYRESLEARLARIRRVRGWSDMKVQRIREQKWRSFLDGHPHNESWIDWPDGGAEPLLVGRTISSPWHVNASSGPLNAPRLVALKADGIVDQSQLDEAPSNDPSALLETDEEDAPYVSYDTRMRPRLRDENGEETEYSDDE
ncbi:PARP domain-containing protein [Streptacidiphilus rugosus]|uniref:hypothetical protein n=1 Tax=Streptacidiphilus rugosus TaxID=405783 RepID=UPI0012FBB3D6|nr:hypothetical protein [Streptacidiphilus rugosus]